MKMLEEAFGARLERPATTLCAAWRLTRRDGMVFGFTDHDEDLDFAGTRFRAATGWTAGERDGASGLGAGAQGVEGGFSDAAIREEELERGSFDGAEVESFRVDWQAPERHHVLTDVFDLGEVTRFQGGFRAELRGLAARLDQPRGRFYRRRCDAVLGDRRCGVALAPWTREVEVVAAEDEVFTVRPPGEIAGGDRALFAQGSLVLAEGEAGLPLIGAAEGREAGTLRLFPARPPVRLPAAGARIALRAGCDRSFATCRDRFRNGANFRGFPHLPGADAALRVAKSDALHDGSPLVP